MNKLDEVKQRVLEHFAESSRTSLGLIRKLMEGKDFSLGEVDDAIDAIGRYQGFVICLRHHAKT